MGNPLESLEHNKKQFEQAEKKFEHIDNITEAILEKKKIQDQIEKIETRFKDLVRKKIDYDNPKRKMNSGIANLEKQLKELKIKSLTVKSTDDDYADQIMEIEREIIRLEDDLSDLESEEVMTDIGLDPLDDERQKLLIEKKVLQEKVDTFRDIMKN